MTLAETLLQKLSDWRPAEEGRPSASFALPDHGWTVNVSADRVDTLSAAILEVDAVRLSPLATDIVTLEAHARKAATRVTGLLEPLRLVEVDRQRDIALLRSDAPPTKGENVLFYEVLFQGRNKVTVQRFQASKKSPAAKAPVPFVLTHEVVGKLVDDLLRE
jgi:hypothetical protein